MSYSMIVAVSENGVIGNENKLPWDVPEDMKFFRKTTKGHAVIMGRKTYESIGRPLPKRTNIIITRNREYEAEGCIVVGSLDEALNRAYEVDDNPFVIGGSQIYKEALPRASTIYLSRIKMEVGGDAKFPEIDDGDWKTTILEETENVKFLRLNRLPHAMPW